MIKVILAKDLDWSVIKHFNSKEFDDPDYPGSWIYMSARTIITADRLRNDMGCKMIIHNRFGVHGAVCMTKGHHSPNSFHNYDNPDICSAIDFHFTETDMPVREQARRVIHSGFSGIGIYQDCWRWVNRDSESYVLPIAYHCDLRKHFQIWKYEKKDYVYLLR